MANYTRDYPTATGKPERYTRAFQSCGARLSVLIVGLVQGVRGGKSFSAARSDKGEIFRYDNHEVFVPCPVCGREHKLKYVIGKYNPKKECNAKCMGATGSSCECSCGGQNHGASYG